MADHERHGSAVEMPVERLERSAFGVIYGSITVMSLLMAEPHVEAPIRTAAILFGSVLAITLAKAFAQVSSDAVVRRRPFGWAEIQGAWTHSAPTLLAANIPTALIGFAASDLYSARTAIALAQAAAISLLAIYGFRIGWLMYGRWIPGLLHAAFTGGIGIVLALLTVVLH